MNPAVLIFLLLTLVSCGENKDTAEQPKPNNFSIGKFNEDQIKNFYIPEMTNVLNKFESISEKTSSCEEPLNMESLKEDWKSFR